MSKTESKKSKYLFLLLRIGVVSAAIIWVLIWLSREQRWDSLKGNFARLNIGIIVFTLVIFTISQVLVSLRWWLILRNQSIYIDFFAAVRLYFLGWFYNNFMPSSVGGDLIRAWYVTRHTEKKFEAVLSVFVDRVIGLISTLVIAFFFYTVFLTGEGEKIEFTRNGSILSSLANYKYYILGAAIGVLLILAGLLLLKKGRAILRMVWLKICTKVRETSAKFKKAVILYCTKPSAIIGAFLLTICMQLMTITAFWILGKNMGITASIQYYYVFFTLIWVIAAIPVSIGGAGVMEGGLVYLFTQFAGVDAESALALALCQRFVWMVTSSPGAIIHLIGAHLPKDFSIDYDEPIA